MNIVLTGFMGTGKTSVSKKLLKLLNIREEKFNILDTDSFIEKQENLKITDIFSKYGEEYFRKLEKNLAKKLSKEDNLIISTGGGIVLDKSNIDNLRKNGLVVCLTADSNTIFDRVKNNKNRPLLNCENPLEKIEKLLNDRKKFYTNCDISLDTSNMSLDDVAMSIKEYYFHTVHVKLSCENKNYKIFTNCYLGDNHKLFNFTSFMTRFHNKSILIVSDTNVSKFYLDKMLLDLKNISKNIHFHIVPSGEKNKNLYEIKNIWDKCIEFFLDRDSLIISLGGGMISDMAGFASSTYMRGIKVLHVPTSLLAMVDASIGGKTGIDLECGKNLIGTFYQPDFVYIDLDFLETLDERQYFSGLAEVIKYSLIYDYKFIYKGNNYSFYNFLEKNLPSKNKNILQNLIFISSKIKSLIVSNDEEEKGLRKILNFGHTLGHSMETFFNYEYLHGEMVCFGMIFSVFLSCELGFLDRKNEDRIFEFFKKFFQIDIFINCLNVLCNEKNLMNVIDIMKHDKKGNNKKYIDFVLLKGIGVAFYKNLDIDYIEKELKDFVYKYTKKIKENI